MANPRVHATTRQVVNETFAEEKPVLTPLPLLPYRAVLRLERRISHEGMISVGGNAYSVPDTTRRRVLEVHSMIDEIRILEGDVLIASHVPLQGRHQVRIDPAHRRARHRSSGQPGQAPVVLGRAGDVVARRSLDFYDALGRVLAVKGTVMDARAEFVPSVVDRIKATLVGLRMPRALEIVDAIVRQLERGEVSALEAIYACRGADAAREPPHQDLPDDG